MLSSLLDRLYGGMPESELFHYTSLGAFSSILDTRCIWATEIRYLNDAEEMRHFEKMLRSAIGKRRTEDRTEQIIQGQLSEWCHERIGTYGHMIFVTAFSELGNLLSQWRSYTPTGQGVSIGFHPGKLRGVASQQGFRLGACIYDRDRQAEIVAEALEVSIVHAQAIGPAPSDKAHKSQSYHPAFTELENDLLHISCLYKNPAFSEEREWRLVSPAVSKYGRDDADLHYRVSNSTLVPYQKFSLETRHMQGRHNGAIGQVYVGPTPVPNLSINSVSQCLTRSDIVSVAHVTNSRIPFRDL